MKNQLRLIIIIAVLCSPALSLAAQNNGQSGNSGKNKPQWTMTNSQKQLPPITIEVKGRMRDFSFEDLILADGYLCPGSARAYKTLAVALPLLFPDTNPVIEDLEIRFGESGCSDRVFTWFYRGANRSDRNFSEDTALLGREQIATRISTGDSVRIVYETPAADGHNPEGAEAGNGILFSKDGEGYILTRE